MKNYYNIVFITPKAAFYKIKLFNEIARSRKIIVLYTDMVNSGNTYRTSDFFDVNQNFENHIISGNPVTQTIKILKLLSGIYYDKLCIGGWDSIPLLVASIVSPDSKNSCIVESSIYESSTTGWRAALKRLFLRNISEVFVPGKSNEDLVRTLGFKGKIVKIGGCGILNYLPQPSYEPRNKVSKFLFVGRFVEVKNVQFLISIFNDLPDLQLNIIGSGPLENELKASANSNIRFLGQIKNSELYKYYRDADVFILPSKSEPWGLVVEEALNNGTPVIVSDRVGCHDDLVTDETGLVFKSGDSEDLKKCILKMMNSDYYNSLRRGIANIDFNERGMRQVECFLEN